MIFKKSAMIFQRREIPRNFLCLNMCPQNGSYCLAKEGTASIDWRNITLFLHLFIVLCDVVSVLGDEGQFNPLLFFK